MTIELSKRVEIDYKEVPEIPLIRGKKAFLFKVNPGDLPYEIFGKDCIDIARQVSPDYKAGIWDALYFRVREDGVIIGPEVNIKKKLMEIIRTIPPDYDLLERTGCPYESPDALSARVSGVAATNPNIAHRIAKLFEERGYALEKKYI